MLAKPDPSTFQVLPWRGENPGTARMFCDILHARRHAVASPTRATCCKRALGQGGRARASPSTPTPRSSSSCSSGQPSPASAAGAGRPGRLLRPRAARHRPRLPPRRRSRCSSRWASRSSSATTRARPGQNEIDLRYADALTTADNIMTFRLVMKEVALEQGIYASFMPKPFAEHPGSGMHTHLSLFEGDRNAFYEAGAEYQLSKVGPAVHRRPAAARAPRSPRSPTSGSTPTSGSGAAARRRPTSAGATTTARRWSGCRCTSRPRASRTRVEVRSLDSACNPYLAFALMLARRPQGHRGGLRPAAGRRGRRLVADRGRAPGDGHRAAAGVAERGDRVMEQQRARRRDPRRARLRLLPAQQARGVGGLPRPGHAVRAASATCRSSERSRWPAVGAGRTQRRCQRGSPGSASPTRRAPSSCWATGAGRPGRPARRRLQRRPAGRARRGGRPRPGAAQPGPADGGAAPASRALRPRRRRGSCWTRSRHPAPSGGDRLLARARRLAPRWATTWSRHPEHWRALAEARAADRGRARRRRRSRRGRCGAAGDGTAGRRAARRLPAAAAGDRRPRPDLATTRSRPAGGGGRARRPRRGALEAALAIARAELPEDAAPLPARRHRHGQVRWARAQLRQRRRRHLRRRAARGRRRGSAPTAAATALATRLMRACSASTGEGTIWPVDAALRPEGKNGPLVRTLASHRAYYERWAKTWEFQALLKARPVAGDRDARRGLRRRRAAAGVAAADRAELRRGRPGDAAPGRGAHPGRGGRPAAQARPRRAARRRVQRAAAPARARPLRRLAALRHHARGARGAVDAAATSGARTPPARPGLPPPAHPRAPDPAATGCGGPTSCRPPRPTCAASAARSAIVRDPADEVTTQWRPHAPRGPPAPREALLPPAARRPSPGSAAGEARLAPEAARERLAALGFRDPAGALRHLEALTAGVSRRAAIQRTLLPVMLGWFADEADPDAGLLAFRKVSDELGSTPLVPALLRDEGTAAERLAHPSAAAGIAADLLVGAPESVRCSATPSGLTPRAPADLVRRMTAAAGRQDGRSGVGAGHPGGPSDASCFRIAVADLDGRLDLAEVGQALTDLTAAVSPPRWCGDRLGRGGHRRTTRHLAARRRDGPARRRRAGLRQRRRRAVRPRPAARRRRGAGAGAGQRGGPAAPPPSRAGSRPGSGHRRRPAPRGQERSAGPVARLLPRLLRALVAGLGVPGAAAGGAVAGDAELGAPVRRADRPAALAGGRAHRRAGARDPDPQGADGGRAAPARRRPAHPLQARPRAASRRRVDGPAAPAAARRTPRRPADHQDPRCARGRAARRSDRAGVADDLADRLDPAPRGCATPRCSSGVAPSTRAVRPPGRRRRRPHPRHARRLGPGARRGLPAGRPTRPGGHADRLLRLAPG